MSILPEIADMDAIKNLRFEIYETILDGDKNCEKLLKKY